MPRPFRKTWHYRKTLLGLGTLVLAGAFTASAIPAFAAAPSSPSSPSSVSPSSVSPSSVSPSSVFVTDARVVAHFDFTAGQQPENITLEPNGDADVTFAYAHQVARVTPQGTITILATLPAAPSGTTAASGIVRTSDGTLYVNYLDIGGTESGIWRISRNGSAEPVAALPDAGFLNGLALDPGTGALFTVDSFAGTVWKVWPRTGKAEVWASGQDLQPTAPGGFGVNGLKVHGGSVWVTNSSQGTLLRIPILPDGSAGTTVVAATGLASIDDFSFTGHGNTVLAAQPGLNQVDLIASGGASRAVLTAADGISGPSSVAVSGRTVYVTSAAYATGVDPNLLMARLGG